jgi:hypothetical protein
MTVMYSPRSSERVNLFILSAINTVNLPALASRSTAWNFERLSSTQALSASFTT